jgi:ABC-type lipoprotein export system ATPase subunit
VPLSFPSSLIALYRGVGGGWQLRLGKEFVSEEAPRMIRPRTDRVACCHPRASPKAWSRSVRVVTLVQASGDGKSFHLVTGLQFILSSVDTLLEHPSIGREGDINLLGRITESGSLGREQEPSNGLIELIGVSRLYVAGRVHAVDNVSLSVRHGEFLAVVGPSGSGKTTLLNLMSGLDRPTAGTLLFKGIEPAGAADWTRLRATEIGFVFQSFQLLPALSALENVQIPMFGTTRSARERLNRARELLDRVGLSSKTPRRPDELSSGEKQRVAIARSLANAPSVLLADEPTGNLDSKNAAAVLDLLVELRQMHGLTVVVVTHNALVARDADRVVEFVDGRIACIEERSPG